MKHLLLRCLGALMLIAAIAGPQAQAQTTISTLPVTFDFAVQGVTVVVENTNAFDVQLTDMGVLMQATSSGGTADLYVSTTSLSGTTVCPGAGWTLVSTATISATTLAIVPVFSSVGLVIPASSTVRLAVTASTNLVIANPGVNTYAGGGVNLRRGNFLIGGLAVGAAAAPLPNFSFFPYDFVGSITFEPAVNCTGAPTPGATEADVALACDGVDFTLSLETPPTGIGYSFQWQTSPDGVAWTNAGPNAPTWSTSQATDTWYRCEVTCTEPGGGTGTSTPLELTLGGLQDCYCEAVRALDCDEAINRVEVAGIDNLTTCALDDGYTDYFATQIGNVTAGSSYPITVTNSGNAYPENQLYAWADWDQDGTFDTATEQYVLTNNGAGNFTGTINVPPAALPGTTRLRVRLSWNVVPLPCGAQNYGEIEDYGLNVTNNNCVESPIPGDTESTALVVCPGVSFTLSLQSPPVGLGLSYQWQTSPDGFAWTNAGPNAPTWVTDQTDDTFYRCEVTCAGEGTGTSNPVEVTMDAPTNCYCDAGTVSTAFEKISFVDFSNIANPSSATAGYEDFTSVVGNVLQGQTYPITVSISDGFAGDQVLVWIDLDQNGDFTGPGEQVFTSAIAGTAPLEFTGNITIPVSALPGNTRMRIRLHDTGFNPNATPCGDSEYGQVEDYTLNITAPLCDFPSVTAMPSLDCVQQEFTITVDITALGSSTSLDLLVSINGGTPTLVQGGIALADLPFNIALGPYDFGTDEVTVLLENDDADCDLNLGTFSFLNCPAPNNDCIDAIDAGILGHGDTFNTQGTTVGSDILEPIWGEGVLGDTWYSFELTEACNFVQINSCASVPSVQIATIVLFMKCPDDPTFTIPDDVIFTANAADFNFDWCGDDNFSVFWNNVPAGTYYYPMLRFSEEGNNFDLNITAAPCPSDECINAVVAECNTIYLSTTGGLNNTLPPTACPFPVGPSTGGVNWYVFDAIATENVTVSTCGFSNFDTRISVFRANPDCNDLVCVQLNDDSPGCSNFTSEVDFLAETGETYYVAIHGFGAEEGTYRVSFTCAPPCSPATTNDLCPDAATLTAVLADGNGIPETGDNTCAYGDPNVSCDVFGPMQGVWYTFNSGTEEQLFLTLLTNDEDASYTAADIRFAIFEDCGDFGGNNILACSVGGGGTYTLTGLALSTEYKLLVWNDGGVGVEGTFGILLEFPAQYDAGIDVISPDGTFCSTLVQPEVLLTNNGSATLTSVTITYDIDGGTPQVFNWTGSLNFLESEVVALPAISTTTGPHTFNVATSLPNGEADQIPTNDAGSTFFDVSGEEVIIVIQADQWGDETTWEIFDLFALPVASGGPYGVDELAEETVCLPVDFGNCFSLVVFDAFGDGMCCTFGNGYWEVRNGNGDLLLRDIFSDTPDGTQTPPVSGHVTPFYATLAGHPFCLPSGPADLLDSECNVFTNSLSNRVYCENVPGASSYQFEFLDPDFGYLRRIARPVNNVRLAEIVTFPLTPGVVYFARARADQNIPGFFDDNFGAGCEMGIDPDLVPGCTGLIDDPLLPTYSCGVTRAFGGSDRIWAWPVLGGQQYRFRFENIGEGFVRNIIRPSYVCLLNWFTLPLQDGVSYDVTVEVQVNNTWSGFCGPVCNLTIQNPPAMNGLAQRSIDEVAPEAMLWPNPVSRDGLVYLLVDQLNEQDQRVTVDIHDAQGRLVQGQEFGNVRSVFNTTLEVGQMAPGMYTVTIMTGDQRFTEHLVIQ